MDTRQKASRIRMILSDVDGVLTDGRLIFDGNGHEIKAFHALDGLGIRIWKEKGNRFGFVTFRTSEVVRRRAEELQVDELFQGIRSKVDVLQMVCEKYHLEPEEIAFVGDDLVDFRIMQMVGLAAAPANAVEEIREIACLVTHRSGGNGAIREVIETILRERGEWKDFGF